MVAGKKLEKKKEAEKKSLFRVWIIETLLPAGIYALFVITFIARIYSIPSGSMIPTLEIGDRILVTKFTYGLRVPFTGRWIFQRRLPRRGDAIVFLFDKDVEEERGFRERVIGFLFRGEVWSERKNFIKRVVATPGERMKINDGNLYINGQLIDEPPAIPRERFFYNLYGENLFYTQGELTVPEGNFFTLGDNSARSRDSRHWGFVPLEKVRGKAVLIIWPPGRMGIIR